MVDKGQNQEAGGTEKVGLIKKGKGIIWQLITREITLRVLVSSAVEIIGQEIVRS